jgi:mannose-1-phosphate guanylyltransferase
MDEKPKVPKGDLANAAVYVIEPEVINYTASLNKPDVDFSTEVLPHFMGHIFSFHNASYHRDIGTPASLALAQLDYPLAAGPMPAADDPWYGLMSENGGALAKAFAQAAAKAYGGGR